VLAYLARRFAWAVAMFLVVTVVTYVIFFVVPVDPRSSCGQRATPTCIQIARHYLGLDKPLYEQYGRTIRAQLLESMSEDNVRTARAQGAPERLVIRSHAMRNAIMPIVTMLGMDVGFVLGGLFFLGFVFSMPGLGNLAIESVTLFDYPVTMGVVIFGTLAILVANLAVDVLYAWIDPRVRLA
jgi:ABC-type dipeptide/oligopeptide/nickel transport system permease component